MQYVNPYVVRAVKIAVHSQRFRGFDYTIGAPNSWTFEELRELLLKHRVREDRKCRETFLHDLRSGAMRYEIYSLIPRPLRDVVSCT